ncbi:hypothetical protein QLQ12_42290 [Actinoplanes sp. NEAU-A12]|uniref:Integral membrane protein n=1 Tax=Actinoplanes sandaracinus TaxID=3045177 RepID=A0ABT6WZT2_9ACTN|nr:hypothetical protein [Actinoplanes sandaracinus]MDI6105234.1 hypothetical protein [Actinoplanes sandaracinus]
MTIPPSPSPTVGHASAPGVPENDELERLRAEVAALRARLEARPPKRVGGAAVRRAVAAVLAVLAAFALVTSVVGLWAARTTLNTDRWVATVAPLPQDPRVNAAVAEYATAEVFRVLDVEQRLRAVLPEQAAFVAGPITGQLRGQVRATVARVLGSDRFAAIWVDLNRQLHQRILAVVEGTSAVVTAREDRVEIDLLPLINQVLRELSAQLPTLFGKQIALPDLSSGAIPENLRLRVEEALGVTLPANFAQFTVYDAGRLWEAQQGVAAAKRYLTLFVAGTILLLVAAFVISPRRRRTAVQFGVWLVVAAVAVTVALRAVRREIIAAVPAGTYRDGVDAAMTVVFSLLRDRGAQMIAIGVAIALLAYLVGPGRIPVRLRGGARRAAAAGWRRTRTGGALAVTRGPGLIARHLDPVRVAGLVVAAILALTFSSWTSLLVIVILLAAYEVAVTVIARRRAADPGFVA